MSPSFIVWLAQAWTREFGNPPSPVFPRLRCITVRSQRVQGIVRTFWRANVLNVDSPSGFVFLIRGLQELAVNWAAPAAPCCSLLLCDSFCSAAGSDFGLNHPAESHLLLKFSAVIDHLFLVHLSAPSD